MTASLALVHSPEASELPALIDRAALVLTNARSSAEVLEARELAGAAYDAAKRAARFARAKKAHDDLIGAVYRAQADALEIESQAKRRLADEYDAAQDRGEVGRSGTRTDLVLQGNEVVPTASDVGLTRKEVHEARVIRDAERNDPGIVRRTLNEIVERGGEPTKAALRQTVTEAAARGLRPAQAPSRANPIYEPPTEASKAALRLASTCAEIVQVVSAYGADFIVSGFPDSATKDREMAVIRRSSRELVEFLETVDAE